MAGSPPDEIDVVKSGERARDGFDRRLIGENGRNLPGQGLEGGQQPLAARGRE
jgi:hypothetical protein